MTITEKKVAIGDEYLSVYITDGTGPTVVLLHEVFTDHKEFQSVLEGSLGAQLNLVAIDLPGHGDSHRAKDQFRHYTVRRMASLIAGVLKELRISKFVVVGSGLGGHVGLHLTAFTEVLGVLMVGTAPLIAPAQAAFHELMARCPSILHLPTMEMLDVQSQEDIMNAYVNRANRTGRLGEWLKQALKGADAGVRKVMMLEIEKDARGHEVEMLSSPSKPLHFGIAAGTNDRLLCFDYVSKLDIPQLWRGAIQLIPRAAHLVAAEAPESFSTVIRDFAKSVFGAIIPMRRKSTSQLQSVPAGTKGYLEHPSSRFEAKSESDLVEPSSDDASSQPSSPTKQNPYSRGKVPAGTMPHPSMRFEVPADEQDSMGAAIPKTEVVLNETAKTNPYSRGRIKGGIMPHPSARFEGQPDIEIVSSELITNTEAVQNPNARGRMKPGTMPHPSSRFELVEQAAQVPVVDKANVQAQNPYARGRIPAGTMPHPSSRFEGHPIDRPSTRVRQPPGGSTTHTFG
eukprot:m.19724 g.19724  ORF g.19724 m.19724 type:complete len:512 (+) comp8069_c0_seq2:134-1669(+)